MGPATHGKGGSIRARLIGLSSALVLVVLAAAALMPVDSGSREELFEIPPGTWARRMAGDQVDVLPRTIYLTLGVKDVLLLRNRDTVPQMFGPVLIMPGQDFRLPFATAASTQFDCTAHSTGQMSVLVDPEPALGWSRLAWRARSVIRQILPA